MKQTIFALAFALITASDANADSHGRMDHDQVRQAVEAGQIRPLKEILDRLEQSAAGKLLEAELEEENGLVIYEIKILASDGAILKYYIDAKTGELVAPPKRKQRKNENSGR